MSLFLCAALGGLPNFILPNPRCPRGDATEEWIKKVHPYDGVWPSHKMEWNWVTRSDVDRPRVKWVGKRRTHIVHQHTHVESRKMLLMNLFAGREWRRKRREWACGHREGRRGGKGETAVLTYRAPCAKSWGAAAAQELARASVTTQRAGGGRRGSRGRGYVCTYHWRSLLDSTNELTQHRRAIIRQLKKIQEESWRSSWAHSRMSEKHVIKTEVWVAAERLLEAPCLGMVPAEPSKPQSRDLGACPLVASWLNE